MKDILNNELYYSDLKKALNNIDLSALNNKKIIITGGLGLICSTLVDLLLVSNYLKHTNIDIYVADINKEFFLTRYSNHPTIKFLEYNALEDINFNIEADYIIHGAGLSSPELFMNKPVETMLSNIGGVLNLLEYSKNNNVKRLLYISSSEVYGNKTNDDSFIEDVFGGASINSIRASYSESKRASEVLCRSYSSEYNVDTVIVRPGHIYGPTASPKDQRVSSLFAFKAAKGEDLELKSSGLTRRSYCYSIDCAIAILIALINGQTGESYNIGHDEETTIKEMAEVYASIGKVHLSVIEPSEEEKKAFNPMNNSCLNNDKIKAIGYKDTFTVKEGLSHTVAIIKDIYGF